jgi:signal transduction histidine kinase
LSNTIGNIISTFLFAAPVPARTGRCIYLIFFVGLFVVPAFAQTDTAVLKGIYDRVLDFDETKADSIPFYADFIEKQSAGKFRPVARILALRLRGIHAELKEDFTQAVDFYLESLQASGDLQLDNYRAAALSDLAILYVAKLDQPEKAKKFYLESLQLMINRGEKRGLLTAYTNLGAIYRQLHNYDSALLMYNMAQNLPAEIKDPEEMENLLRNIGVLFFYKREYETALNYYRRSLQWQLKGQSISGLHTSCLNLADVFIELNKPDSARWYMKRALSYAQQLSSAEKQADSYGIMSKYYYRQGDFKLAYDYLRQQYKLDSLKLSEDNIQSISALQEKFNARKREQDNRLLVASLATQQLEKRNMTILAIGLFAMASLIAIALFINRKAKRKLQVLNDFVQQQNEKLTELNLEKNSLISIVSHDLGTPFANIRIWNELLQLGDTPLDADQAKAVARIQSAVQHGESLIQHILDVEKSEMQQRPLHLEKIDLGVLVHELVAGFQPLAQQKGVQLHYVPTSVSLISDRQYLLRLGENLLSNAIKFTDAGKSVYLRVSEESDTVWLIIRDEGVGIKAEDLPQLFTRYSNLASRPTGGERTNGLGLSIVKRIVQELNGKITCTSEWGMGSEFTVTFKK